jgi:hypothetical protein
MHDLSFVSILIGGKPHSMSYEVSLVLNLGNKWPRQKIAIKSVTMVNAWIVRDWGCPSRNVTTVRIHLEWKSEETPWLGFLSHHRTTAWYFLSCRSVRANFSWYTAEYIACISMRLLPLADAAYLASIVIYRSTHYIVHCVGDAIMAARSE